MVRKGQDFRGAGLVMDEGTASEPSCGSVRYCIVTRRCIGVPGLIRFVLSPDGDVVPDLKHRLPGRGCWVRAGRDYVFQAVRRGLFSRSFGCSVRVAEDLPLRVDKLLSDAALEALSLARKAGYLVLGEFGVVEGARAGELCCIIHASDGASNGLEKLRSAMGVGKLPPSALFTGLFSSEEIGHVLGFSGVVHVALRRGAGGESFSEKIFRLMCFRCEMMS